MTIETHRQKDEDARDIWDDWREVFDARPRLAGPRPIKTIDDVQRAIADLRTLFAEAPIKLGDSPVSLLRADGQRATTDSMAVSEQQRPDNPIAALEQHVADVDAAYDEAREAAALHGQSPEWARIRSIHAAVHHLWDTFKEAAGSYLTELAADIRLRGLFTALIARAAASIGQLSSDLAARMEHTSNSPAAAAQRVASAPDGALRNAYVHARSTIRADAASYEWNRISALWGTVNTLARHNADPGIRAVTARCADAISDLANTLAGKMTAGGRHGTAAWKALGELSRAADHHASRLRGPADAAQRPGLQAKAPQAPQLATQTVRAASEAPVADLAAIKNAASQVAQRAQSRIARKNAAAPQQTKRATGQVARPLWTHPPTTAAIRPRQP